MDPINSEQRPTNVNDLNVKLDDDDILAELGLIDEQPPGEPPSAGAPVGARVVLDSEGIPIGEDIQSSEKQTVRPRTAPQTQDGGSDDESHVALGIVACIQHLSGYPWKKIAACCIATLIVVAAGWIVAWMYFSPAQDSAEGESLKADVSPAAKEPAEPGAVVDVDLEPFIVPLEDVYNDPVFLRVSIRLHAEVSNRLMLLDNLESIRRAAYMVMKQHTSSDFFNSSSAERMSREILHAINQALHATILREVTIVDVANV